MIISWCCSSILNPISLYLTAWIFDRKLGFSATNKLELISCSAESHFQSEAFLNRVLELFPSSIVSTGTTQSALIYYDYEMSSLWKAYKSHVGICSPSPLYPFLSVASSFHTSPDAHWSLYFWWSTAKCRQAWASCSILVNNFLLFSCSLTVLL